MNRLEKHTLFLKIILPTLFILSACTATKKAMTVAADPVSGQTVLMESGKPVLQYNYKTVNEKDVVRTASKQGEAVKYHPISGNYYELARAASGNTSLEKTSAVYGAPRSDYIHPLFGLDGEMLTCDWPVDGSHPHHRGIFWAWPEVDYGSQRSDVYKLQGLFSRPTGKIKYKNGREYAEVQAENQWLWRDEKPIVREEVTIRAYHTETDRRCIDLTLRFYALEDSITIATRFTNSYGGLNVRMETPKGQNISYHSDNKDASPRRAYADFNGVFEGKQTASGMTILQHKSNPEYPGTWVEYPNLSWVQPTFPTPNTRYPLVKGEPLTLRYRLVVHQGGKPDAAVMQQWWDEYNR
jgi:hypothetical protein